MGRQYGYAVAPRMFKNFINGEWVESRSGKHTRTAIRRIPTTNRVVCVFERRGCGRGRGCATEAYKTWRLVRRLSARKFCSRAELLVQRKEDFSKDMTREMGKVLARRAATCRKP